MNLYHTSAAIIEKPDIYYGRAPKRSPRRRLPLLVKR